MDGVEYVARGFVVTARCDGHYSGCFGGISAAIVRTWRGAWTPSKVMFWSKAGPTRWTALGTAKTGPICWSCRFAPISPAFSSRRRTTAQASAMVVTGVFNPGGLA